jgi:hypothetical protein
MPRFLIGALALLSLGAGCSLVVPASGRTADFDAGSQSADAALADAADARLDAPMADVPLDAPGLDAPGLDAPGLDAPGLDAPGLDAGLDAPGLDAPGLDGGSDAGTDAPMADVPCTRVTGYLDGDGDGFGAGASREVCSESGLVLEDEGTDCDDDDTTVYPGATDTACDGVDADCDGVTDPNEALVDAACGWGVCTTTGCDVPVEIEAGWYHTCARLEVTGRLLCWGRNDNAEFGPGAPVGPTPIPYDTGVEGVVDHCTTGNATCFIEGPRVRCFGAVIGGFPADFTETAVGWTPVEIACGDSEFCVRGSDGSVRCAGSNGSGQGGATPSSAPLTALNLVSVPSASQITVGAVHACAVISGGTVACWGGNDTAGLLGRGVVTPAADPVGAPVDAPGVTFASVEAMNFATCARTTTNAVYCWGATFDHQVVDRPAGAPVLSPTVSSSSVFASLHGGAALHACGLSPTGEVRCWGVGQSLALGRADVSSSTPGLAMPGRSILASDLAVASATASAHTCAIERTSGRVYCWGANDYGQCGAAASTVPLANAVEVLP